MPTYENVYLYAKTKLLLFYGIAILFSIISIFIGLLAMLSEGASYTNNFSTITRTSRHAEMDVAIDSVDIDGEDPLPTYLANANISFRKRGIITPESNRLLGSTIDNTVA